MEPFAYKRMAEIQEVHWWYEGRRNILRSIISNLVLPASPSILEVGCGPGANLRMLGSFGSVAGMEPEDFARQNAKNISGCDITSGTLPHNIPYQDPFDIVCAFDVIEHVDEDQESIKALYAITKPGGYAIFTVPAHPFLWSYHDSIHHHKRRYKKCGFTTLLKNAGYKIEFISYYNFWLFPIVVAVRFLRMALHLSDRADDVMPRSRIVNTILSHVFGSERFLLRRTTLPFGVSILAVCRRPPENA